MFTSQRFPILSVLTAIFWFCGVHAACPLGDLTGDCVVNAADLQQLGGEWLAPGAGAADLNADNDVNMVDFGLLAQDWRVAEEAAPAVAINELHTNPDVKTDLVEFVELYNAGTTDVDLSGWQFTAGVFYTFPDGTILPADGYLVVAQYPDFLLSRYFGGRLGVREGAVFGPYGGALDGEGERVVLCDAAGNVVDEVDYGLGFPWPTVGDPLVETQPGSGCSLQLVNPALDNDLGGSWRSSFPSPAAVNRVVAENVPPHIRQVKHAPKQPKSGEVVTITAKVTDPDGVASVTLRYQEVVPGAYIARHDGAYGTSWVSVEMRDNELEGDARAADDIFTVQIPADVQKHRNLVRYKIHVVDNVGYDATVPYPDDPQPNFAYFVYDGVPAWRGAVQPGATPVIEFPPEVMRSLPVYHLISKKSDVETATWFEKYGLGQTGRKDFKWWGTLVYDGKVYDHIRYRMRGGVWRYSMGKNMFKFDFNRGHYLQAHDDYGRPYDTTWDKLNFSACIQQGSFGQRGEQGMFEAVSFRMFNMVGCPASKTNYLHFRIIDEYFEDGLMNAAHRPLTTRGTQYDGDFWGLHMTIEQMDGRFLDEHDLPDGNFYKMDNNVNELNNQGPTQPSNGSDLSAFLGVYRSSSEQWWRQNVNLEPYYGYYAVYHAVHHGDITGKNWFMYHHPVTNQWWQLPWDVDLTWTTYYGGGSISDPFMRAGVFNHSSIDIETRNRVREVCDLLFNPDQTGQLIDEYAAIINDPAGGLSMVDADRAMWDYHWVVSSSAYPQYLGNSGPSKAGQGRFYQKARQEGYEQSFEGMVQVMKDYIIERTPYMNDRARDSAVPATPTITATGPADFPINALTFRTSAFNDPQGAHTFGSMQWRIAEVTPGSQAAAPPSDVSGFILLSEGATWKYFKGLTEPSAVTGSWRQFGFDDSDWLLGHTVIGYGESFISTNLSDMRYNYSTVYLRKIFNVADPAAFDMLILELKYDDGVNVWINGKLACQDNVSGENLPYNATAQSAIEDTTFVQFNLGDPRTWLTKGNNIIAVQLLNANIGSSSDCFIDVRLVGQESEGGAEPSQPVTPRIPRREPGKYEIDAVWASDELTTFNSDVTIPAAGLRPGRTYRVRCRMKDNTGRASHWSSPVQFVAAEPLAAGILADLRVTEVMYNPPAPPDGATDNDEFEFIELRNIGDETLDLSSVSFTNGITFDFAGSDVTTLGAGRFVLVVRNKEAFLSRYGSVLSGLVAGEYQGKLANDGENVALVDLWNGTIAEFEYGDGRIWPVSADGGGHSLVPLNAALPDEPQGSLNYPGNWRASAYMGGSPGQDDPTLAATIVINELMANTNVGDPMPPGMGSNDWVELYNPTSGMVSLAEWYLSDDVGAPAKLALPAISIPPKGRVVIDQLTGFGLSQDGEELLLSYLPGTAEDRVADCVQFKAQEPDVSLGRYPDGDAYWFRLEPSPALTNANPILDIVIDELMYHPVDPCEEYVELYNPTSQATNLGGETVTWRLDGAVEYDFPAGASIPAGGRLVIVGFDPAVETARLAAFTTAYGVPSLTAGVKIVGPWSGNLSNRGERIAVEKSQPGADPADPVVWVIVDEVIYSDVAPWPTTPDGLGDALQRVHADADHSGNDPANWQPATPFPGAAN